VPTVTWGFALSLRQGRLALHLNEVDICLNDKPSSELERTRGRENSPSTQAGEFVREEIHHVREGKHGTRSPQQAIAIGLSKARRAGVKLPAPKGSATVRKKATQDERAAERRSNPSSRRSRATEKALQHEGHRSAGTAALSRQAKRTAAKRGKRARSNSATKAAPTRKEHS